MKLKSTFRIAIVAALLPFAFLMAGCDAESPTEPASQAQDPQTEDSTAWNLSITASPSSLSPTDVDPTVTVQVRASRVSNGSPPAAGTTAVLSTDLGTLSSSLGVGTSVPVEFQSGGVATAVLSIGGSLEAVESINLQAQLEGNFATLRIPVGVEGENFATAVSPSFGPPAGGTVVQISGNGFEAPVRAFFVQGALENDGTGVPLENVQVVSDTLITAVTPRVDLASGAEDTYNLVIEQGSSFAETIALANAFTYTRSDEGPAELVLISITPSSGPNEGGTEVLIRGDGFGSQAQVFFSNGPLIEATVLEVTPTTIRAVTPSATGPNADNLNSRVDVIVRDPITGQEETLAAAFQYGADSSGMFISAVGPTESEYLGGVNVTIFGQGFDEPVAVEAGGVAQQPISVTGTEIIFRTVSVSIGCAEQSGAVSVTNIETAETVSGPDFTYRPVEPLVLGVDTELDEPGETSSTAGPENGGNQVTIGGVTRSFARGFEPPVRVLFNGRPAGFVSLSADGTELVVTVPAFTDEFATEECETGGETGERNVPFAADVEVINLDTGCNDVLPEAYLYNPSDTTCRVQTDDGGGDDGVSP